MAKGKTNGGAGGSGKSEIIVYAPTGSTVTVQRGTETPKTASEKNGVWTFKGCDIGTWKVNASLNGKPFTKNVVIQEEGQLMRYEVHVSYVKIYGIQRNITQASPEWVRTDDAVGFSATASVGTQAGHSDFDDCYPWSGIQRETLSTGDVMVKIPKFWFKRWRDGNVEHIQIADDEKEGFKLHPAFNHANAEKNCVYVGAYLTSSNNRSLSKKTPTGNKTRGGHRSSAKSKGTGWGILDGSTLSAIQMLYLVEFANYNSQAVLGQGNSLNETIINTGTTDNVPNLTGSPTGEISQKDIVYRGIETVFGNMWQAIDGVNWNGGTYYVCNNPTNYGDDKTTGYTALSFTGDSGWYNVFATRQGLDVNNPHIMFPTHAVDGSETTHICDMVGGNTGWRTFLNGAPYNYGTYCGIFANYFSNLSTGASAAIGSRLMYIP